MPLRTRDVNDLSESAKPEYVPDAVDDEARRRFSDKELANLTAAAIAINGWSRVTIAYRTPPAVASATAAE